MLLRIIFNNTGSRSPQRIKENSNLNLKEHKFNISFLLGTFLYSDFPETTLKETQKNLSPTLSLIKRKLLPFWIYFGAERERERAQKKKKEDGRSRSISSAGPT